MTSKKKTRYHTQKRINKDRLFTAIRILVSVSLFAFLIIQNLPSVRNIFTIISSFNPFYLIIALFFFALEIYFKMLRWNVLLEANGVKIPKIFLMRSYYIGFFYSHIFPTNLGGDVYRGFDIYKNKNVPVGITISSVIMERVVGVTSGALFVLISYFFVHYYLNTATILAVLILPVLVTLGVLALLYPKAFKLNRLFVRFKRLKKFEEKFYEIHNSFYSYRNKSRYIALSFLYSTISQLVFSLSFYFANLYTRLNLSLPAFFFLNPIILLSANIPFSIGGFGVRENITVLLLKNLGASNEKAFVLSIVILFMILFNTAIGGIIYILRNVFKVSRKTCRS